MNSKPVRQKHAETSAGPDARLNTQMRPPFDQPATKQETRQYNGTKQQRNEHQPRETTNQPTKQTY